MPEWAEEVEVDNLLFNQGLFTQALFEILLLCTIRLQEAMMRFQKE